MGPLLGHFARAPALLPERAARLSTWSQVRSDLEAGNVLRETTTMKSWSIRVSPAQWRAHLPGDPPDPGADPVEEPALHTRNILVELAASVPGPSAILLSVLNSFPWFAPNIIDGAMQAIVGDYVDSYRAFNIGMANDVPAFGSEIGFPMDGYPDDRAYPEDR